MNFAHLRELIVALRDADPGSFTMAPYFNSCGTPACVLGWHENKFHRGLVRRSGTSVLYVWTGIDERGSVPSYTYFGLTPHQHTELFGATGCGNAQTPGEAIAYIEKFILDNGGTLEDPQVRKLKDLLRENIDRTPDSERARAI